MDRYDLYSYIEIDENDVPETDKFTKERAKQYVENVYRITQRVVPMESGRLRSGWFKKIIYETENSIKIEFGYRAINPENNKNYAMPVDYFTGGYSQSGFFSGAVKLAYRGFYTKKMGNIREKPWVKIRGVNTGDNITLPGRYG